MKLDRGRFLPASSGLVAAVSLSLLLALLFLRLRDVAPSAANDADRLVDATQGVYTEAHHVRSVGGHDQLTEDVVEIAPVDPTHVFVRMIRRFDVGHSCSAFGIATFENDGFVYRTRQFLRADDPTCTLWVRATGAGLSITDLGPDGMATCRAFCGERGNLSEFTVSYTHRRPIPDLALLMRSDEYVEALSEFNENARGR